MEDKQDTKPKPARDKVLLVVLLVLTSLGSGFAGGWLGAANRFNTNLLTDKASQQQIVLNESQLISGIAKDVGPSVVSINVLSQGNATGFFGTRSITQESAGTGFIVSEGGIVLTNRHVVPKGITKVSITLSDGTELDDVVVVGRTTDNDPLDVAFLKINDAKGKQLKPVRLGESAKVEVGEKVIAIGNALGQFQNTVTAGIISGFGRSVEAGDEFDSETLQNLFQTDTAINQGNSGGPLVNINGEVIGINTAVAGDAENIGFSIPIDDVKGLIASVLEKGELKRPYLGVRYVSLTDDLAFQFGLDIKSGAYILPSTSDEPSILPGSPASKVDLREGDVILGLNDKSVDDKNSLVSVLGTFEVGEIVELTINREGREQKISVTLESAPED